MREKRQTLKNNIKLHVENDKTYEIKLSTKKNKKSFIGQVVQKTTDHITFVNKYKIRESFLIKDFFIGEYKIKEIA